MGPWANGPAHFILAWAGLGRAPPSPTPTFLGRAQPTPTPTPIPFSNVVFATRPPTLPPPFPLSVQLGTVYGGIKCESAKSAYFFLPLPRRKTWKGRQKENSRNRRKREDEESAKMQSFHPVFCALHSPAMTTRRRGGGGQWQITLSDAEAKKGAGGIRPTFYFTTIKNMCILSPNRTG